MLLLIDNYDSFTYNLYQMVAPYVEVLVIRNDEMSLKEIEQRAPEAIIISPGPKTPHEAGISMEVIEKWAPKVPILGVCLGMQSMGLVYGGKVVLAPECVHGRACPIYHHKTHLFKEMPLPFMAARYHSWIVERESFPPSLQIEAYSKEGLLMGLKHKEYPCYGIQFHPESILTPQGPQIIKAFLEEMDVKTGAS